jgi:hypothetical protein
MTIGGHCAGTTKFLLRVIRAFAVECLFLLWLRPRIRRVMKAYSTHAPPGGKVARLPGTNSLIRLQKYGCHQETTHKVIARNVFACGIKFAQSFVARRTLTGFPSFFRFTGNPGYVIRPGDQRGLRFYRDAHQASCR